MNKINEQILKYVSEGEIDKIRDELAMMAYMADKNDFDAFVASAEYAINKLPEIFEPHREVIVDKTSEYKAAAGKLMEVFSRENYDEVIRIGSKYFVKQETRSNSGERSTKGRNKELSISKRESRNKKSVVKDQIPAIMVVAGLIAGALILHKFF